MDAEILSIGTEVACGAVVNSNAAWLAQRLTALGCRVRYHVTTEDCLEDIRSAIERSATTAGVIVISGGLGPTRDDLTREALGAALGEPLVLDEASARQIRDFFARIDRPMAEVNLQQAMVPRGARALANPWGTAPGIRAELRRSLIFALPGVPREMKAMFERYVDPELRERASETAVAVRVLRTYGEGESVIGQRLANLMDPHRNPAVGTQASEGLISIRIIARGPSVEEVERLAAADAESVREILGDLVFGEGDDDLQTVVGGLLKQRNLTISTAESCTGGWVAKAITDVPGSSAYFVRGYVAYSNEAKVDLLGVDPVLIETHGAVSEPVAEAMALGCRRRAGSDLAISVTGIAGPTGGTTKKPVGLVYIGLADEGGGRVRRLLFGEHLDREAIRDRTWKTALNLLRRRLMRG